MFTQGSASTGEPEKITFDRRQPDSWSAQRRWTVVLSTCLISFLAGVDATSITSALSEIGERFDIDDSNFEYTYFTVTAWSAGAAIFPLFLLPIMEDFGIRKFYLTVYILFMVFVMAAGLAPDFVALVVFRAFAGSFGGVLQNVVDAVAADVWKDDIDCRTESLTLYTFCLLAGVTFGPVFGGVIIKFLYWRWIFYIELIMYGVLLPYLFLVISNTRPPSSKSPKKIGHIFQSTVLRSARMLFTEVVISTFTLWSSFCFGTVFIFTQSIPQVFSELYGWNDYETGLVQIAVVIGEALGYGACLIQNRFLYYRLSERNDDGQPVHEGRLYLSMFGGFVGLAGGYFVYAWSCYPSVSWIGPTIGLSMVGFGVMTVVQAVVCYVTDSYASHAGSAVAANAFGENMFAAFLPLATLRMYRADVGMGFHWASSFLGFLALLLSCVPIVLMFIGPSIRKRSPFMD